MGRSWRQIKNIREMAKTLQKMTLEERQKILKEIAFKDPEIFSELKKNMVRLDDLQYLTVSMIRELMQTITTDEIGLALRVAGPEVKDNFLTHLSSSLIKEITEVLEGPAQPKVEVQKAVDHILNVVREKVEKGEFVIDESGSEEYV